VDRDPPGEHGQAPRGHDRQDPHCGPALCASVRQQMDHPEHHAGQGGQDMPQDDRRGQSAGGGTLAGDVVFDEPHSQQVQPEERRDEPADQCGNAHPAPSAHRSPAAITRQETGGLPHRDPARCVPPKAVTTVTDRNLVPVTRTAHGAAGTTPAGSRYGRTTPPDTGRAPARSWAANTSRGNGGAGDFPPHAHAGAAA
jgi:hypothetical protein